MYIHKRRPNLVLVPFAVPSGMHPWIAVLRPRSHVERAAFWIGLTATYGVFATLATTEGVGYVLRLERTADPNLFLAVPVYNPVLWIPAVLGAGAWSSLAWANTVYWLTAAVLGGLGLSRLARRPPGARPRPDLAAARGPGRPRPEVPAAPPRAPARTGSPR